MPLLPIPTPASVDARNRAARTLAQGLLLDVGAAAAAVAATGLADVHWTRAWWVALGLLVVKTALQAAVSYAARKLVPPATS
jgi:hypothetical protein